MKFVFFCSGDFDIHYDADFANTSVFRLLEKACVFLMKESQKMKQRGVQSSSQHHSLLCKMIWRKFCEYLVCCVYAILYALKFAVSLCCLTMMLKSCVAR